MNEKTYEDLRNRLSLEKDFKECPYIYSVYDVSTDRLYQLNEFNENQYIVKYFNIVIDEDQIKSPIDYPSTFYCTSVKDLEKIVLWTLDHKNLYAEADDLLTDDPYFDFNTIE